MAFVVEDGTGLDNATSYVSVEAALAYHADMGNASWTSATTANQQTALIRATSAVDQYGFGRFRGTKETVTQALEWPRKDAYDVNGYELTLIPSALKKATYEAALVELENPGALTETVDNSGQVHEERVEGAVTVSYFQGSSNSTTYTAVTRSLASLLTSVGQLKVDRV